MQIYYIYKRNDLLIRNLLHETIAFLIENVWAGSGLTWCLVCIWAGFIVVESVKVKLQPMKINALKWAQHLSFTLFQTGIVITWNFYSICAQYLKLKTLHFRGPSLYSGISLSCFVL